MIVMQSVEAPKRNFLLANAGNCKRGIAHGGLEGATATEQRWRSISKGGISPRKSFLWGFADMWPIS
jgi:hypothetical protein